MKTHILAGGRALTVVAGVGAVSVVGVAFALWSQTGTGSGGAEAHTAVSSVVTAGTTTAADLYPGFAGGDLYIKVTNPNPYPVRFTSMTVGTITSSNESACPKGNITVTPKALAIDVPANTTTAVDRTIADVVTLASAAPDGCQGKTFTIGVTLSGTQQTS